MKNIVLLLLTLSILPGCNDDENTDQQESDTPVITDTTDPAAPVIDLDDASDTGRANDDNITSDRTPTFTITNYKAVTNAENVSVKWFIDYAEQTGETGAIFTTSELSDRTYVVTARFIDAAGNFTNSAALSVTIDTTPAAPVIDLDDASDTGTADDDNITSDRTPTFTITNYKAVTNADNVSVKWFIDGAEQTGETGATFTTSELSDGTYVVTAQFIDVSGSMTESNAIMVVINTTSQNANGSDIATQIFGMWQLIEFYSFSGLATGDEESNWNKVENGYILEFKPDSHFVSSEFEECQAGTFTITSDESDNYITLKYGCEGFVPRHNHNKDYDKDILSYSYVITDSIMELKPVSYTCYEGCNVRLTKINNETQ